MIEKIIGGQYEKKSNYNYNINDVCFNKYY